MKHHYYRLGLLLALWPLVQLASGQGLALRGFNPSPNARSAPQTTNVSLLFNQGLSNNAATLNGLRVFSAQRGGLLRNGQGGSASVSGSTLNFNPTTNFKPGETVFVTSTTAIQSTGGARLSRGQVYQFTTGVGGSGRGNFTPPAVNPDLGIGNQLFSLALGDVDGDGDLDFVTANANSATVSVWLNNGSGNFTPHPTNPNPGVGSRPLSVALGDVDGDGDLDFVTANQNSNTVSVRLNNGSGSFTAHPTNPEPGVGSAPTSVALGDVDGDGDLDLLCANNGSNTVSVRLNNGSGNFIPPVVNPEPEVGRSPISVALGDVDEDGDLDLLCANYGSATVSVRLNDGAGNFTAPPLNPELGVGRSPTSVALGDVDGDGDLDLLCANDFSTTVRVRLNDGSGNFTPHPLNPDLGVGDYPYSVALGDVDGDGDLDLLTANEGRATVSVRFNDGTGNFTAPPLNPEPGVGLDPYSVVLGDLDGDGDLDLLTANQGSNNVSVRLNGPFPLTLTGLSASPNPVCVAQPFSVTASVGNFTTSYSYTLSGGSNSISGTATTAAFSQPLTASGSGIQSFTLTVSSEGQVATATTSVTVNAPPSPTLISSGTLTCGSPSVTLIASGGGTYRFSNGATQIGNGPTATVTMSGLYSVTVTGSNGCSATATTPVQSNTAAVTLTTPTVSTATLGQAFSQPFTATGGTSPYSYSLVSGSLPAVLSLATTGVLSGTITQTGSFTITVLGRDANGCSDVSEPYRLTVSELASSIRYVKAGGAGNRSGNSWADASDDLQSQIDFAGAQQVWVAQGTYKPGGTANTDRTLSFAMRNGVSILGGFAASGAPTLAQRNPGSFTTVLSGDIGTIGSNSDNSLHVINNGGLNATAMLDGFIIRDGNANDDSIGNSGGGMYNNGSSPTVTNCSFLSNSARYGGGVFNQGGSPALINCSFLSNSGFYGGGINNSQSSPGLTNCSFLINSASAGGGIFNFSSNPSLTNCVLYGNGGANTFTNGNSSTSARYSLLETTVTNYTDGGSNLTTSISPFMSSTDARLNGCSPAINTGNNAAYTANGGPTTDLAGNPRFFNNGTGTPDRIDMGAYEYQATPTTITLTAPSVSTATLGQAFSQPFTATGGTSPYSYSLTSGSLPTGLSLATTGVLSGTPTQSGSFTITVLGRDASGCSGISAAYVLTVNEPASVMLTGLAATPNAVCVGSPVTFTATVGNVTGSYSYTLTNGLSTPLTGSASGTLFSQSIPANGTGTLSFTLTVTANGQSASSETPLTVNPLPVASLTNNGPLSCAQSSVTLTAGGAADVPGSSYTFASGSGVLGTQGSVNTLVVSSTGTYSVTVASASGCVSTTSTIVTADQTAPSVSITPSSATLSCASPSVSLTALGTGSVRWSTGETTPIISVNTAATYSVTLTSTNGCSAVASAVVSQDNTAPVASLVSSGTLSCAVTSVTLTATPNGLSYVFSTGAIQIGSTNQAVVSVAGPYSVTVLSGNGCSAVAQTSVTSSTAVVSVTTPTVTTATQGVAFSQTFTATGGISPYSYNLVSGSVPTGLSLSATGILSGTPTQAGSFTLTVGATDANGCSGVSAPYNLTISEPIFVGTLRLIAPAYNCQSGAITFRTVGGDGSGTPVEYRAIGVTDWTTNPNQVVDLPVRQDANAQPLTLQARQNGVMVTYSFDFRLYCNSTVPNQPPVFTQPPTQTATVGQPFAYRIPDNTFRDLNGTAVNFIATNLPANLSYSPDTRVISGTPTAVGSYSVALSVSDPLSQSASGVLVIQVNPVAQPPVSTTVNQAPVFNGPLAAQTGTVGQGFGYQLPAGVFTDPNAGDVLTYSAAGLPAGVQFVASSQTISGTPTMAGTYSVSLTATDPSGLSASGLLTITISTSATPPPTGNQPLAVIQPLYDCQTGAITFRTTGGDGSPTYFSSVGIVGYSNQTSYVVEAPIRQDANSQPLLIKATQSGITTSYLFDFRLYCNGTVPTTPPVFNGPLPTQTGQVGVSLSYQLPPNSFTALNGGPFNYAITGLPAGLSFTAGSNLISGVPTQAGSVTATITATDPLNQSGQGPLVFVITPAATQPPVPQPLSLVAPLYNCQTGSFTFQTSGGDGTVIEYFAVGITNYTTIAGPYTVLPASDAQPFTLKARQRGVEVSYTWDFKAVCSGSARIGVAEVAETWTLRSVGNPVTGELVVEVVGAAGQSLELQLTDLNGHVVASRLIQPTSSQHREVFEVSRQGAGVLLLQAQSLTRRQTLKVLKL